MTDSCFVTGFSQHLSNSCQDSRQARLNAGDYLAGYVQLYIHICQLSCVTYVYSVKAYKYSCKYRFIGIIPVVVGHYLQNY